MKLVMFITYYLSIGLGVMIITLIASIIEFKTDKKTEEEAYKIISESKSTYLLIWLIWPIFVLIVIWAIITEGTKLLFSTLNRAFERLIRSIFKDL